MLNVYIVGGCAEIRTLDPLIKSQVSAVSSQWTLMPRHSKIMPFQRLLWIVDSPRCPALHFSGYLFGI